VLGYAAKTCQRMARQGDPTRGAHGWDHVNRLNGELVDMALVMIGRRGKRLGLG